jgi:hypothetical protein
MTTDQSTYDNTTHLTMNATHTLTTTTTDLLSQNNSAAPQKPSKYLWLS